MAELLFPHITPGCNQIIHPSLDFAVFRFLTEVGEFRRTPTGDRALHAGMRSVRRIVRSDQALLVVVAIDINDASKETVAGLNTIVGLADERGVPVVYALGRRFLGQALRPHTDKVISAAVVSRCTEFSDRETRALAFIMDRAAQARKAFVDQVCAFTAADAWPAAPESPGSSATASSTPSPAALPLLQI